MENGEKSGGIGAITGAIIIIVIIIAGGWYFIGNRVQKIQEQKVENAGPTSSPEVQDIQTDLNNLDLNVLN